MQGVQALNTSIPQQSLPRQSGQPWQNSGQDNGLRRNVTQLITHLFKQRQSRTHMQKGWNEKMPDFVRRLEDALYRTAHSKEEYSNPDTLEHRLQLVAQRMVNHQGRNRVEQRNAAQDSTGTTVTTANGFVPPAVSSAASTPTLENSGQQLYTQPDQQLRSAQQGGTASSMIQGTNAQSNMLSQATTGFQAGPSATAYAMGGTNMTGSNTMLGASVKAEQSVPGLGMQREPHAPGISSQPASEGLENIQGVQQPSRMSQAPTGGSLMSNGVPVLRNSQHRDPYGQPNQQLMSGMAMNQQPGKMSMSGPMSNQLGVQGNPGLPINASTAPGMQHVPRSPALQNRVGNGSMVPLNNPMIPMPGGQQMGGQSPMGSSPLVSMSMLPASQQNQGDLRRPGSAGMVPINGPAMPSMGMMGNGPESGLMPNGAMSSSHSGNNGLGLGMMNGPVGNGTLGGQMGNGGMQMNSMHMNGHGPLANGMMPDGGMGGGLGMANPMRSGPIGMGGLPNGYMAGNAAGNGLMGNSGMSMHQMNMGSSDNMMPSSSMPQGNSMQPGSILQGGNDQSSEQDFQLKMTSTNREYIAKQQRWLLFLRHCAKCSAQQGECQYGQSCTVAKALWSHILECANPQCPYPRCLTSRELLKHHQKCQSQSCPICTPVKQYVQKQRQLANSQQAHDQAQQHVQQQHQAQSYRHGPMYQPQHQQMLREQSLNQGMMNGGMHPQTRNQLLQQQQRPPQQYSNGMMYGSNSNMMMLQQQQQQQGTIGVRRNATHMNAGSSMHPEEPPGKRYRKVISNENTGTSLLEAFSYDEIKTHLNKLRDAAFISAQALANSTKTEILYPNPKNDAACSACGVIKLAFEPPAIFCSCCSQKIKRNQTYYSTAPIKDLKGNWCHNCFVEEKRDFLELDGQRIKKVDIIKRKNDGEQEEAWVECDQCNRWVHQICGLFNKGRNNASVCYLCPDCLCQGIEMGRRKPIEERPQAMLEAKDLPRCSLSDFIESQLRETIALDTQLRAKKEGIPESMIPDERKVSADGLTVRVINNITKKLDVKQKFLETFRNEGYPEQLQYKQKVIILFQRINGVDVVLYTLYMQEYGDDCLAPNSKWVYLSYLDSVKYFEPEIASAIRPGVALRTVVYHDILQSYLQYIKQRGFCAMFIWACPPFAGDDYILHCHPSRQRMPRSDRLREWYLSMLRVSKEKGVVTHLSNLYDTFFEGGRDHKEKATSTAMPYLDGDYWPGEAENLLNSISEEARQAGKKGKKASLNSKGAARPGKKGKRYGATGTTDEQLMGKLGETIQGMKEDFIVVHLQEPCSFCRTYISDDDRWYHPAPPTKVVIKHERSFEGINLETPGATTKQTTALTRFQLCSRCYENEKSGEPGRARGMPAGMPLYELQSQKMEFIAPTHDTGNPVLASEFFDTRQQFLSLCQGNHYQFDTLRRAKHSSMMVLYHLHNPEAPAFACTCNECNREIEAGGGYRCTECADYDLCKECKDRGVVHPHPLRANLQLVNDTQVRLTQEQQADRAAQLQRTMNLLVHASACNQTNCVSSNCVKVKALFQHAVTCNLKVSGGCHLCRRMWALLQLHAKQCQETSCPVPRCRELREMRRRQTARQEAQRRTGYQKMLQQQQSERQMR